MSRTDAPYTDNHNWQAGEKRSAHNVLLDICSICGFDSYGASASTALNFISFTQSDLTDKTCGELLDLMSETAAGVWACLDDNLYLVCFGSVAGGNISAQEYAGIEYQGKTAVIGLVAKNSSTGKTYTYGTTTGNGVVVQIENGLVNENTAGVVWTRISDYEYTAWNCEKADITTQHFNFCGPMILNMDMSYHPRSVDLSVDSTGIYFSGGCPAVDEWNYRSKLEREKIGIGKAVGNAVVTRKGDLVFVNKNNEEGGGLNEYDNGIGICVRNKNR